MAEKRETQKDTPTFPPEGTRDPQREKQMAHGAQSDQGGAGQTLDKGGNKPRAWEGPEESDQQRR